MSEVADWLIHISTLLDPEENPYRMGDEVKNELVEYLDQLLEQNKDNPTLFIFASKICKTTGNYASGFHTYDVPALPRTNNDRESEFRGLNQRLLRRAKRSYKAYDPAFRSVGIDSAPGKS